MVPDQARYLSESEMLDTDGTPVELFEKKNADGKNNENCPGCKKLNIFRIVSIAILVGEERYVVQSRYCPTFN